MTLYNPASPLTSTAFSLDSSLAPSLAAPVASPALLDEHGQLSSRIERYWSRRAESYGIIRHKELHSDKKALWLKEILALAPAVGAGPHAVGANLGASGDTMDAELGRAVGAAGAGLGAEEAASAQPLRILDVGTGTGFFAIVLAELGHTLCAVDMCADMLHEGQRLAAQAGCRVHFQQMDASRLDFDDASFDLVISRNLTWTLPDAAAAYREWQRVLRPGGMLLNFDADYGATTFAQQEHAQWMHAHQGMDADLTQECESIRRSLPLSAESRPQWDVEILQELGFTRCLCDTTLSERIYAVRDETFNPVPMFSLCAVK